MSNASTLAGVKDSQPLPANIVIFGASGDLTKRKLIPALARMYRTGLVHPASRIIGVAREIGAADWIDMMQAALDEYAAHLQYSADEWRTFSERLRFVSGDLNDADTYTRLAEVLETNAGVCNALFYLAIPPEWYVRTAEGLAQAQLNREDCGYRRIVIEKPFGLDHATSIALNRALQAVFAEAQIYRIDHYLGKESVQNLFVFRFGNSILEPLWNRNYIDHVQISVTETLGVEYRAPYYEKAGALRDMIQSHMMQVLTLVAMEPPCEYTANAVRDEKVKVLRSLRVTAPDEVDRLTVAAQYGAGEIAGEKVPAYCREPGVAADSITETFAAARLYIDNWRWQGVPFVLWYGKRLKKRASEIVIRFRQPPHNLFDPSGAPPVADALVFRLQPDEGMFLRLNAKQPGLTTNMRRLVMRGPYASATDQVFEAYEILLNDVLLGDATLFSRADEIEESWLKLAPILEAWSQRISIDRYRAGTWDVPGVEALFEGCVGGWHKPT
ncbi:MAG: glucose-6-phosphate dehydrogenase [Pseudomonadota bacterium]